MTKVIYVRHAQTSWNHSGKYQGFSDIGLNEEGKRQALLVAKRLAKERIAAIYSSDLLRSLETANVIAKPHGLVPIPRKDLREINFGLWEGLTYCEIMKHWPEYLTKVYTHPKFAEIPDGESFSEVQTRAKRALVDCLAAHQEETILVVSHGGILRVLFCDAMGIELDKMWLLRQDSVAINIIDYYEENTAVVSLFNDTCHML